MYVRIWNFTSFLSLYLAFPDRYIRIKWNQQYQMKYVCVNDKGMWCKNKVHSKIIISFYIHAMFVTEKAVKENNQTNNIRTEQSQMNYKSLIWAAIFISNRKTNERRQTEKNKEREQNFYFYFISCGICESIANIYLN